jgi:acyl-CoA synthetase (AMP-forming)/AMP-acid ligase II
LPQDTTPTAATLLDLLRQRAEGYRDKVAFSFSYNGDEEHSTQLTYHELDIKARAIASNLQQQGAAGERVLVLCGPGLDHVAGFFGCIYAGAVAVPVHERLAPRLSSVVPDAQARFALATAETQAKIKAAVDALGEGRHLQWGLTDEVGDAESWVAPDVDPNATAMVQYTSGSTTSPKGVVLTHRNLLHNLESIRQVWPGDDTATGVFWLPSHHDMGLIGAILSMLNIGSTTHLMSPTAFIKRPMRWLEAVSRHRATFTVAPNFAYDLCVEQSSAEERAALDLSSLTTAMNGAEPVHAATLQGLRRLRSGWFPAGGVSPGVRTGRSHPAGIRWIRLRASPGSPHRSRCPTRGPRCRRRAGASIRRGVDRLRSAPRRSTGGHRRSSDAPPVQGGRGW